MGTPIGDLLVKEEIEIKDLKGKTLGFDTYNILYQFLTTIRGVDGDLLTNSKKEVTSHLIGLQSRVVNFIESEIKMIFVFDGEPIELKKKTLEKRKGLKIEAQKKAQESLDADDLEGYKKYSKMNTRIDQNIINSTKEFLDSYGIPYMTAPADAEAQLSVMNLKGDIDGVVSQDYDSILFGAKDIYRNLTISGKKKAPGRDYFITIKPEHINTSECFNKTNLSREKMIWIAMMIGNDFNQKIPKIGPKTAIKLATESNSFEEIETKYKDIIDFDYKEISNIFLNPMYSTDYSLKQKDIDPVKVRELLVDKYEFNKERIEQTISRILKATVEKRKQSTLSKWF